MMNRIPYMADAIPETCKDHPDPRGNRRFGLRCVLLSGGTTSEIPAIAARSGTLGKISIGCEAFTLNERCKVLII